MRRTARIALLVGPLALMTACAGSSGSGSGSTTTAATTTAPAAGPTTATAAPTSAAATTVGPTTIAPVTTVPGPTTVAALLALGRPVVLAHAGGDDGHPHSTPFAFGESVREGADALDLDVQRSADRVLVVHHDDTVDRTTNETGPVGTRTYAQLHALDDAYWFTDQCTCQGQPDTAYLYRGIRTGGVPAPDGYTPDDFAIARFTDVATRWPDKVLNIEIKGTFPDAVPVAEQLAQELHSLGRESRAIVTSFDDQVLAAFHAAAPSVELSPGLAATAAFVLQGTPLPAGQRILQVPPVYEGIRVLTPEFVQKAKAAGYLVWVWPNDGALEHTDGYRQLFAMGIDGIDAGRPAEAVAARPAAK